MRSSYYSRVMLDVFSGLPGVREDKKRGSRSGRLALPTLFLLVLTFTLDLIQVFDALHFCAAFTAFPGLIFLERDALGLLRPVRGARGRKSKIELRPALRSISTSGQVLASSAPKSHLTGPRVDFDFRAGRLLLFHFRRICGAHITRA